MRKNNEYIFRINLTREELAMTLKAIGRMNPPIEESQPWHDLLNRFMATFELYNKPEVVQDVPGKRKRKSKTKNK